jgi:hypothetical protein
MTVRSFRPLTRVTRTSAVALSPACAVRPVPALFCPLPTTACCHVGRSWPELPTRLGISGSRYQPTQCCVQCSPPSPGTPPTHPPTHPPIRPPTHPPTHPRTHPCTHPPTHTNTTTHLVVAANLLGLNNWGVSTTLCWTHLASPFLFLPAGLPFVAQPGSSCSIPPPPPTHTPGRTHCSALCPPLVACM